MRARNILLQSEIPYLKLNSNDFDEIYKVLQTTIKNSQSYADKPQYSYKSKYFLNPPEFKAYKEINTQLLLEGLSYFMEVALTEAIEVDEHQTGVIVLLY